MMFPPGTDEGDDADPELYERICKPLGIPYSEHSPTENYDWFWYSLDIIIKNDVVKVYWKDQLVFTELEDRFPSEVNLTKLRLIML